MQFPIRRYRFISSFGEQQSQHRIKRSLHQENEFRLEVLIEKAHQKKVLAAMFRHHPYEEVAYEIYPIENFHQDIGSGMYADLESPVQAMDFLKRIKEEFGGVVRYTQLHKAELSRIAWCGGSGSFLLAQAKAVGADLFLSSDFKYHQFFEAENQITIADIGHYENEQYTIDLIAEYLQKKFPYFCRSFNREQYKPDQLFIALWLKKLLLKKSYVHYTIFSLLTPASTEFAISVVNYL